MIEWLDQCLITGPRLALVLNPEDYDQAMRDLGLPEREFGEWLGDAMNACAHMIDVPGGGACVVSMRGHEGRDPIEVAGLLVHEAVHVFQYTCRRAGEKVPSDEFEAYAIQNIAMRLMASYVQQITPATTTPERT